MKGKKLLSSELEAGTPSRRAAGGALGRGARLWRLSWRLSGRLLRVSVAAIVVLTCFGIVMGRSVYANVKDGALHFGDELMSIHENSAAGNLLGDYYRVRINGQTVSVSNGVSMHGAAYVLSRFEQECKERADGLVDQFASLQTTLDRSESADVRPKGIKGFATVREVRGERGYVMCFAEPGELTDAEKVRRLEQAVSGNLGALGDVRYVYAQDSKTGEGTHVFAAWADGEFNLAKMFPKDGDAPGEDAPGAPRPEGSRRLLSGAAEGAPYGVIVYQGEGGSEAVLSGADAALARAGWTKAPVAPEITQFGRGYSRGNVDLVVTAHDEGNKTGVAYIYSEMGGRAVSTATAE
jgi:hypothetical protein